MRTPEVGHVLSPTMQGSQKKPGGHSTHWPVVPRMKPALQPQPVDPQCPHVVSLAPHAVHPTSAVVRERPV